MTQQPVGRFRNLTFVALAVCLGYAAFAHAIAMFALTTVDSIVEFDSAIPGTVHALPALVGFGAGEDLISIDLRPANQRLYALTRNPVNVGHLYTINTSTGVATLVGTLAADPTDVTTPYTALSGIHFGMNFNPVPDRIRLVSDDGTNMRVNADTALVTTDAALNPGSPHVVGVAYTNSFAGATSTTLYDIDSTSDHLLTQNPPNNGTLNDVGGLGATVGDTVGFDIATLASVNYGFAALTMGGSTGLWSVNLATGGVLLIGDIGTGSMPVISLVADVDYIFRDGFQ